MYSTTHYPPLYNPPPKLQQTRVSYNIAKNRTNVFDTLILHERRDEKTKGWSLRNEKETHERVNNEQIIITVIKA